MNLVDYFTIAAGMCAIVAQYLILRFAGERQRCEGRMLLLLDKIADWDLKEHKALGPSVTELLSQKAKLFLPRNYIVKGVTDPVQRTMLNMVYKLERRRAYLDKLNAVLFTFMIVCLATVIYLIFQQ
tara:strand:+ start:193 stop:573 length:381 start_codon:yes stop_codon:yes gene_type:complete